MNKKIISLLIAITMVCMSLSGCGDPPPSDSVTETATEQTTVTTPTDLTEEEMKIWEGMPEIVTMRVLNHYEAKTTEIMYIEKTGVMKSFVCDEYYNTGNSPEWFIDKINAYNAETIGVVDLHALMDFYSMLLLVDLSEGMYIENSPLMLLPVEYEHNYEYIVYGLYKNGNNVQFAKGQTKYNSYIDDLYGKILFLNYLDFDTDIPQFFK